MPDFLNFIKNHLKIILVISLPLFGIVMFLFNNETLFRMNPASLFLLHLRETEYFTQVILDPNNMVGVPFILIGSNLLFWVPVALLINKLVSLRKKTVKN